MDSPIMPGTICLQNGSLIGSTSPDYHTLPRGAESPHSHWTLFLRRLSPSDLIYPTDKDDDEEEEEEHPALADSILPIHRMTTRISIRDEPSISLPPREKLLSSDHRIDKPEITLPPWKRLGIDLGPRYEIGESSAVATTRLIGGRRADYGFVCTMDTEIIRQRAEEVGYGIRDVWVDPREAIEEVAPMTLEGDNTRVTELAVVHEQDTHDIYAVIGDTQDRQTQMYQRVETLVDDGQYHYETARLLDQEALVSREAWGRSIEVSYMVRSKIWHYAL
ncbi:hypothetical protein Tco_0888708 [Tanacetum coccineum]